jgi:hypothetical protein
VHHFRFRTLSVPEVHFGHRWAGHPFPQRNHEQAITEVRNWLATVSKRKLLPGGAAIVRRYNRFTADLPALCTTLNRQRENLNFADLSEMIGIWLKENR